MQLLVLINATTNKDNNALILYAIKHHGPERKVSDKLMKKYTSTITYYKCTHSASHSTST